MSLEKNGSGQFNEVKENEDLAMRVPSCMGEHPTEDLCRNKFKQCFTPRTVWRVEEDEKLSTAVLNYHEANWKAVAAEVGTKDATQCMQKWKRVLRPDLKKGRWSIREDALLVAILSEGFFHSWVEISKRIAGRSSKQTRERWHLYLDPRVKKGGYTNEEDKKMLSLQKSLGNRWNVIASHFSRRTENDIKARSRMLAKIGFNGELTNCCTKYPPASRKAVDNRTRLRQTAAKVLSLLNFSYKAAVSLPGHDEPFVVGDTMDISNVPDWKGPLNLKIRNGFAILVDSNCKVTWSEARESFNSSVVKEEVEVEQKGMVATHVSATRSTSPALADVAFWGKCTSGVESSSSPSNCSFEEFGDKSENHFFEGLNVLGVAADLKTNRSLSGERKQSHRRGESSECMQDDDDSCSSTTNVTTQQHPQWQQQVGPHSNRSPLISFVINRNLMNSIPHQQPQPLLCGTEEDSIHMQSRDGCDLPTTQNHVQTFPHVLSESFIPV